MLVWFIRYKNKTYLFFIKNKCIIEFIFDKFICKQIGISYFEIKVISQLIMLCNLDYNVPIKHILLSNLVPLNGMCYTAITNT